MGFVYSGNIWSFFKMNMTTLSHSLAPPALFSIIANWTFWGFRTVFGQNKAKVKMWPQKCNEHLFESLSKCVITCTGWKTVYKNGMQSYILTAEELHFIEDRVSWGIFWCYIFEDHGEILAAMWVILLVFLWNNHVSRGRAICAFKIFGSGNFNFLKSPIWPWLRLIIIFIIN